MSASADDLIFEELGQGRALPGITARQVIAEGIRALSAHALPVLDAQDVAFRVRRALDAHRPLSLIRLGDGEALALAHGAVLSSEEVLARAPWLPQHGLPIPNEGARNALLGAVRRADLVGVPLSRSENYQPLLADGLAAAALHLSPDRLTHSLVNYELWKLGLLEPLLPGRRVLVIGGPAPRFQQVLAERGASIVGVIAPVAGIRDADRVVEAAARHRFDIALVSAGIAACVICPRISQSAGAVALDFGACADEVVAGEPWRVAPQGTDGLVAELVLRWILSVAEGSCPEHLSWEAVEIGRRGGPGTYRCTARWERDGCFGRRSFIVKTGRRPERLAWEASVLGAVHACNAFAVPAVHLCDAGVLGVADLGGTPLSAAAWPWWRVAARNLAAFHTQSRTYVPALPPVRRFSWDADRAAVERAVGECKTRTHLLTPASQTLREASEAIWMRISGTAPAGSDRVFSHGDFRAEHVLVPHAGGGPVGVVGWRDAGEGLPAGDLAALAADLPPGMRNRLLGDYLAARVGGGWPCDGADLLHDFGVMAGMRLMKTLADVWQREAATGSAADAGLVRRLGQALRSLDAHPPD